MSIGEFEGPEEYLFGAVAAIAVDGDQNVFVLDWQAQEIRQYDAFGDYVGRLARRGEGPGELSLADAMAFLPDGRLVVPDQRNGRINLNPVFDGDHVWAVTRGELDVQRVVRYRVVRE